MDLDSLDVEEFRKLCGYDILLKKLDSLNIQTRMLAIGMLKNAQELVGEKAPELGQVYIRDYSYFPRKRESFSHSRINEIIEDAVQASPHVDAIISAAKHYKEVFAEIPLRETRPGEPYWLNNYVGLADGVVIYTMLAQKNPRLYVEVGSGNTTKFAAKAIRENKLRTKIISIDPHPRAEINDLCDTIHRTPLEETDLAIFSELGEDDILLLDNSHRAFPNSDVTVFFTEILPALAPGVMYTLHDIALPDEIFVERFYNEQYMLAAYLLGGAAGDEICFPTGYLLNHTTKLKELQEALGLRSVPLSGGFFWMRKH